MAYEPGIEVKSLGVSSIEKEVSRGKKDDNGGYFCGLSREPSRKLIVVILLAVITVGVGVGVGLGVANKKESKSLPSLKYVPSSESRSKGHRTYISARRPYL